METLTRLLFIASLACIGWLSYRLDTEATAHQATMEQVHLEREANMSKLRTLEQQRVEKLGKIEHETQSKLDAVSRDTATARRAADGLRGQLAAFTKRGDANGVATTEECSADRSRVDLLAQLLAELDSMAGEYATAADESRQRGLACEMSYEAAR